MTNHFSLARFLLWIPPLLWYRIIWGFSAQTASASGKVSDGLLHRILIVLSPAYARSEADIQGAAVEVLSFFERKAAHMFLYFLLVILLLAALAPFVRNILRCLPPVDGAHRGHAGAILSLDGIPVDIQHDLDAGILR